MLHQLQKSCMPCFSTMSCVTTDGINTCYTVANFASFANSFAQILECGQSHWLGGFSAGATMYQSLCQSAFNVGVWASVHSCGKLRLDGPDNDCGGHLPDIC